MIYDNTLLMLPIHRYFRCCPTRFPRVHLAVRDTTSSAIGRGSARVQNLTTNAALYNLHSSRHRQEQRRELRHHQNRHISGSTRAKWPTLSTIPPRHMSTRPHYYISTRPPRHMSTRPHYHMSTRPPYYISIRPL